VKHLLKVLVVLGLLFGAVVVKDIEAKKFCDSEIKKEKPNKDVLKKECLDSAKYYESQKEYENTSWYYLLAGDYEHNIKILQSDLKKHKGSLSAFYRNMASSYLLKEDFSQAKIYYKKFLYNTEIPYANTVTQEDFQLFSKLYPNQKRAIEKGQALWNAIYQPLKKIDRLYSLYKQARETKKYKDAITDLSRVIALQKESGLQNRLLIADNLCILGVVYNLDKNYTKSLEVLQKVEKVYRGEPTKKETLGYLLSWIADDYENLLQYNNAIVYYLRATAVKEKILGKTYTATATSYNDIGEVYYKMGDYPKALRYYQKALAIREKVFGKIHPDTAISYNDIGVVYADMGDYPNAFRYYQKALTIREKVLGKAHLATAISYNNIGGVYESMGNYHKALSYYQKVVNIFEKVLGKVHPYTAISYGNIGGVYESMGDYHKALSYYQKALAIHKKVLGTPHPTTAISYGNIGGVYYHMGDYHKALSYYQKVINIFEKVLGKAHPDTATSYGNISYLYQKTKAYSNAYHYAKKAFDIFLLNRDKNFQVLSNKQKKLYLEANSGKVPLLLENAYLYREHNATTTEKQTIAQETFNDWIHYKGAIFDSENAIAMLYQSTKDKKLKAKVKELIFAKRNLAKLYQSLPKTEKERATYQTRVNEANKKIASLEQEIASNATAFKEFLGLRKVRYKDIVRNLKDNELYIDFAKAGKNYYIFTLDSKEKITFRQIDKNATREIDKNVKAFRDDIKTIVNSSKLSKEELTKLQKQSKETLAKLYSLVLEKPLKDILPKYSSLIISPDGALRLLPFEALYDAKKSKYLIEEKNLKYIPSGKELIRLFKFAKKAENKNQAVVIADPDFNKNVIAPKAEEMVPTPNTKRGAIIKSLFKMHFKPLPGTKQEAKEIAQTIKEKIGLNEFIKDKATEQNLYKVNSPKFLHIATHGFFIKDNTIPNPMLKSGIALTGANAGAIKGNGVGIVTALKLSGLNLKGTDLVVLSACETGVVDTNSTESVSGLAKAFIQAGAKDIVMSLWSVDDKATKDLMTQFYKNISAGDTYTTALKKAKLKMIQENMHPFYWAGFILNGV